MFIKTFASGSDGNLYLIEAGSEKLLLECGLNANEMLKAVQFDTLSVSGCFVSHEHS